jgi:hypothetical protein
MFREMVICGAKMLGIHRAAVDSMNVFPVPDGDTGTNMSHTLNAAVGAILEIDEIDVKNISQALSKGTLKGARGNSGVILSQILKGFSAVLSEAAEVSTKVFAAALKRGTEVAYSAVTKPKEGTMLTVIRMTAEYAESVAAKNSDFSVFMQLIIARAEEVLKQTPDMLPVLKKAGVVDAGGKGLTLILKGFLNALDGVEISEEIEVETTAADLANVHNLDDIEFAYCTEFVIVNILPKTTEADIDKLKDKLMKIGDCVVVIGDLTLVKVHVHTNTPDIAIKNALVLGEIDGIKIENMLEQNRVIKEKLLAKKKPIAVVAVSLGEGLSDIFKEGGAESVIEGGQTMNPSVRDFLDTAAAVNSDNIIILPNNKNVILAAEQAKELSGKKIFVVPTESIPEGIAALLAFSPEDSGEENAIAMKKAAKSIKSASITRAVKNAAVDGFKLKTGDIIGIGSNKILAKNGDMGAVLKRLIGILLNGSEAVNLYFGNEIDEKTAQNHVEMLKEIYQDIEIAAYFGGQPHYDYLISIE